MVAYQPNQELDFGPVRKMVEFQIKNGIDGLFMGGLSTADVPADHGGKAPRR